MSPVCGSSERALAPASSINEVGPPSAVEPMVADIHEPEKRIHPVPSPVQIGLVVCCEPATVYWPTHSRRSPPSRGGLAAKRMPTDRDGRRTSRVDAGVEHKGKCEGGAKTEFLRGLNSWLPEHLVVNRMHDMDVTGPRKPARALTGGRFDENRQHKKPAIP